MVACQLQFAEMQTSPECSPELAAGHGQLVANQLQLQQAVPTDSVDHAHAEQLTDFAPLG